VAGVFLAGPLGAGGGEGGLIVAVEQDGAAFEVGEAPVPRATGGAIGQEQHLGFAGATTVNVSRNKPPPLLSPFSPDGLVILLPLGEIMVSVLQITLLREVSD